MELLALPSSCPHDGFHEEMQKRVQEPRDDMGMVRGIETIRAGSPDLPPLAPWEAQQGPLILGDWLLLAAPIIADLSLTAADWWKDVVWLPCTTCLSVPAPPQLQLPVVPRKAVAEVSKIRNLWERLVVVNHGW